MLHSSEKHGMISGVDHLFNSGIEPGEGSGKDRVAERGTFERAPGKPIMDLRRREQDRQIPLVGRQNIYGKQATVKNAIVGMCGTGNVDDDVERVERHGGKGVYRQAEILVTVLRGDDGDPSGETPHNGAEVLDGIVHDSLVSLYTQCGIEEKGSSFSVPTEEGYKKHTPALVSQARA